MPSLVSSVLQVTVIAAGKVIETAATAATIPVRAIGLIGQTELLINRMTLAVAQAEDLIKRVTAVAAAAEQTVAEARALTTAATLAVDEAAAVATTAGDLIRRVSVTAEAAGVVVGDAATALGEVSAIATRAKSVAGEVEVLVGDYSPTLRDAAPLAAHFVAELTPDEVTAAIRMIDEFPALQRHLVHDVMPLLGKLDQVGPDLHKLLEVTEDLHLAIAGLPGLKMLRRRGEERAHDA
ncbi:hypothetical protein FHR83_000310 [Actinoplanes campanulatus]|uniref:Ribulose 1,5-bisphosphate carboxylase large subunit n=1 Tax=Actinoplanes campanulatus TaxID=113559 RepID=A0A7W5AAM7_9ACTN|nr:hypothetical protein [Actinoplanes campanulatus]MBB3092676.1 hypothetical protein [Actinoplanes campanulatus]GGM98232.1 hypothetical protein GCM10010109_02380 [Actinoplanes campanulatus]